MPSKTAVVLKLTRQIHRYLGIFATPAILFFAITGALQTFSLHETTRGSDYKTPVWLMKLGQLHKKQTLVLPVRRPEAATSPGPPNMVKPPDAGKASEAPGHLDSSEPGDASASPGAKAAIGNLPSTAAAGKSKNLLPMKIFFLLISVALVLSTFTGLYMAYKFDRSKSLVTGLLLAGVIVPVLLLLF